MKNRNTILITGASRGFGRALLEGYGSIGWRTVPLVQDAEIAISLESALPDCYPVVGDVSGDSVEGAILDRLKEIGQVDVLVNNAGVPGQATNIASVNTGEVCSLFQTHCIGALRCTKALLPFMRSGRRVIVNVTSRFGSIDRNATGEFCDHPISYSYRIAKAGQNMSTAALAQELGGEGFIVCGVHPGKLKTRSGSLDADTEVADAANNFILWVNQITSRINGRCFDLGTGEQIPW